jgi:hypothetical protein
LVREDQRLTIREVTEEVGVYFCSCQSIWTEDLGIRCFSKVCPAAVDSGAEGARPLWSFWFAAICRSRQKCL